MFAIRKEVGKTVASHRRVYCSHNAGFSAAGRHSEQRTRVGRENNCPIGAPGSAARNRRGSQNLRCTSSDIDTLQLAIGKETYGAAVRRPKWEHGAFRARERPAGCGGEIPNKKHGFAFGKRRENYILPVR